MKPKKKFNGLKIGNKTTKNPFESSTYAKLAGLAPEYVVEYESTKIPYVTEHVYIPDFKVGRKTKGDGPSFFFIETKGNGRSWTPQVRKKMLAVKDQWPELDIRILFYSDGEFGTRRKDGSRQRQSEWATKHGFPYAIREVPEHWLT